MPTTVNIQWNSATNKWQASPASVNISTSGGIVFNMAFPPTKTGVRICFSNSNVFGVNYLEYTTTGNQTPAVTGSVNQSSPYHCQDAGTTCVPQITADEPYDVIITSSPKPKPKPKPRPKPKH
jgi:hypothetical protein